MLTKIVPAPYRWAALALLGLALVAFGYVKGVAHEQVRWEKLERDRERATATLAGKRADVTARVDLKYAPALTKIQTVTKETIRYVPQFVPSSDCPVSGGFRVFHDAAAEGRVPDPAGVPDAAPAPAADVAATVADNYGTCREDAARLTGLQEWVREQLRLNATRGAATR